MNNKIKQMIIMIILVLTMTACRANELVKVSDYTYLLGTIVKLTLYDHEDEAETHFKEMFEIVSRIENEVSKNLTTSEISAINEVAGKGSVKVSPVTLELLMKGLSYSELSKGKFDITIGPLVNLWDIGGENARVPSEGEIKEILPLVNYNHLLIDEANQTAALTEEGMVLDLGGIAKGYVADQLVLYMKENGIEHGIINLGGNIVTVGSKPDGSSWKIGLQNPIETRGKELGIITCTDLSIVTSGIYERYIEQNGVKYHHILDPSSGYPYNNNLASVTILSEASVDGDGLSTAVFAMGLEEGLAFIEASEDIEAIFITKENELYMTSGAEEIFELTNDTFTIRTW